MFHCFSLKHSGKVHYKNRCLQKFTFITEYKLNLNRC